MIKSFNIDLTFLSALICIYICWFMFICNYFYKYKITLFLIFFFKFQSSQIETDFTPNKTNYHLWSFHTKYYMKM